jgi:cob(I)alamin adenosyltransferase
MKREGRLQVYTGNGKGKTTAMLGLAVRAACSGMRVYIGQFMKGRSYSELCFPERFPEITMEQFGTADFIRSGGTPSEESIQLAQKGLNSVTSAMLCGVYDMVSADEICVAVHMGLISEEQLMELARARPANVELVLTGRNATAGIIEMADLVTEMVEVKHYYNTEKLPARPGIEN